MADDLIPYGEFPKYWDPKPLKRLFTIMIVSGLVGIGVGIALDNRRIIGASTASLGAGGLGQIILKWFKC